MKKKNKSFPTKQKSLQLGIEPGSKYLNGSLTTTLHSNTTETGRNLIIQIQFSIFL